MLKRKQFIVIIPLLLIFGLMGLWFAVGPKVLASISPITYQEATYNYTVEADELYDFETDRISNIGIIVVINPNLSDSNPSQFSEAYLQTTGERATQWATTPRTGELIDVMLIFNQPLTSKEVNQTLSLAKAHVFESGVVGYKNDIPFATYTKEEGPLLTRPLQEYAGSYNGFETEITLENQLDVEATSTEIYGFLAVRVWVQAENLQLLLTDKNVRFVDTTPQVVRDQLANNRHWQDSSINTVTIEMPVWGYDW